MPHVFISYVREDLERINQLCNDLNKYGVKVWLNRNDITPGIRWKQAIRRAIQEGAFFIACYSKAYNSRYKTYMNEELTLAIDELRIRPRDRVWFIPVKLNECEIPDWDISAGQTLRDIQWVDLHKSYDKGLRQIISVVQPNIEPLIWGNIVYANIRILRPCPTCRTWEIITSNLYCAYCGSPLIAWEPEGDLLFCYQAGGSILQKTICLYLENRTALELTAKIDPGVPLLATRPSVVHIPPKSEEVLTVSLNIKETDSVASSVAKLSVSAANTGDEIASKRILFTPDPWQG